jgi:cytochrome c5
VAALVRAQTPPCDDHDPLDQGWNCAQQWTFWYTPQGSAIIPYDWFLRLNLVRGGKTISLKEAAILRGYIASPEDVPKALNPGGLPIGFAVDMVPGSPYNKYVGMTCAACHTALISLPAAGNSAARRVIVNGGPTNADFFGFLEDLVAALRQVDLTKETFQAFADDVIQNTNSKEPISQKDFEAELALLVGRVSRNSPAHPYGRGRLDAFGGIFNQIVTWSGPEPANAPVSYPPLWLSNQSNKVQWNGSASNDGQGPLVRNIGEALGVFGRFSTTIPSASGFGYWSTLNLDGLEYLESAVQKLKPPKLPDDYIERSQVEAGAKVYKDNCVSCHALAFSGRANLDVPITSKIIRWGETESKDPGKERIATDSLMTITFLERSQTFGRLSADKVSLFKIRSTFPPTMAVEAGVPFPGRIVLGAAIINSWLGIMTEESRKRTLLDTEGDLKAFLDDLTNVRAQYKAGPLNGVWATGPYLHNGSVATIDDLLKDPKDRTRSFCQAQGDFDPDRIGFKQAGPDCSSILNTSFDGNKPQGHYFGILDPVKIAQLKQYLKTL